MVYCSKNNMAASMLKNSYFTSHVEAPRTHFCTPIKVTTKEPKKSTSKVQEPQDCAGKLQTENAISLLSWWHQQVVLHDIYPLNLRLKYWNDESTGKYRQIKYDYNNNDNGNIAASVVNNSYFTNHIVVLRIHFYILNSKIIIRGQNKGELPKSKSHRTVGKTMAGMPW